MKRIIPLLLLLASVALAQPIVISPRSIVVNPVPDFEVQVWVDKDPSGEAVPTYQVGEGIRVGVNVSESSYIYLYSIKSTGEVQQILPNRFDAAGENNFVQAGQTKFFPPAGARYQFTVDGPQGLDKVIAVASRNPLNTGQLASFQGGDPFAQSSIGESGFAGALSIIVEPIPRQNWVTDTVLFNVGQAPQAPRFGSLRLSTQPSGARAFVDGTFAGITPTRFDTRPGQHNIRFELDGYETFTTSVNLRGGDTLPVSVTLNPVVRTGTATFTSQPSGAQVLVDGEFIGTTPTGLITLNEGTHIAEFQLGGYQTQVLEFTVERSRNRNVNVTLVQRLGTLVINANVGGAQVFINGSPVGTIPSGDGRLVLGRLPVGTHELTVIAPSFTTDVQTFRIRAGETTEVRVRQDRLN